MTTPSEAEDNRVDTFTTDIERGRLLLFCQVIGETDPLFTDTKAARQAGHPDIVVPPTFLFGLELDRPNPFGFLATEGIELSQVLHGEQGFRYHVPLHAGDTVTFRSAIVDRYVKGGGALKFFVRYTSIRRDNELAVEMLQTIIARVPVSC